MSKLKKSRKHSDSADEEVSESSASDSDDAKEKLKKKRQHQEEKQQKPTTKKPTTTVAASSRQSTKQKRKRTHSEGSSTSSDSASSTSSASSSSSTSSDEEPPQTSNSETEKSERRAAKNSRNGDVPQESLKREKNDTEENNSKWDSPHERSRHQNFSKRRDRDQRSRSVERDRSRDRGRERDKEKERPPREQRERDRDRERDPNGRGRNDHGNIERIYVRRDYREREGGRYRNDRAWDERDRRRDHSPRRERERDRDRPHADSRFKRESQQQHSPPQRQRDRPRSPAQRRGNRRRSREGDSNAYEWGGRRDADEKSRDTAAPPAEKEKPNFALSGALTEDANKVNGVVVKYAEPPEARKPKRRWRLYPFKGETALPTLHIHRQSCFLVGRDRKVVDLAVDHPSCSKQHAALQYRLVPFEREDGTAGKRVRLYLIDLESANGTFLNNKKIDPRKYYELMEKDVIKFGFSTREYVLLHENSKEDQEDDDVKPEPEDIPDGPNP